MIQTRTFILGVALATGIAGSFAFKTLRFDCSQATQFVWRGSWLPAGQEGIDYTCISGSTCTYYDATSPQSPMVNIGDVVLPCQAGTYCNDNCLVALKNGGAAKK